MSDQVATGAQFRGIGKPRDAQARLLLPLRLPRRSAAAACAALEGASLLGAPRTWQRCELKHFYRDEVSPQVRALLSPEGETAGGPLDGRYLRVDPATAQKWFRDVVVEVSAACELAIELEPSTGIELFVSGHGVGVLSFTFVLAVGTGAGELLDAGHSLAQGRRRARGSGRLRTLHPREDADRWARIPAAERARMEAEPIPADDAPLAERLGRRGAAFSLFELAQELLGPLASLGRLETDSGFLVYSAWRFERAVDFVDAASRRRFEDLASSIAQVEEAHHAAATGEDDTAIVAVLNDRHVAAVCGQGAAHLVADQPEVPFNEERLARVRDKYFVPFLAALLGRTIARRLAHEAAAAVHGADGGGPEKLGELRRSVLDFSIGATPIESSHRAVVNRYYRMCEEAMASRRELERVDRTLAGLDAYLAVQRQERLFERVAVSAEQSQWMQRNLEWIEIFLVFVYTAELAHVGLELWHGPHFWAGLAIASSLAVAGAVIAGVVLKPWKHHHH